MILKNALTFFYYMSQEGRKEGRKGGGRGLYSIPFMDGTCSMNMPHHVL